MSYTNPRSALQLYNQIRTHAGVEGASPHRLIQMLMEGALEKIMIARGYMERKNVAEKARHIDWAVSIIEGLQNSLDMDNGGEIAHNLDALYDYMQRRLVMANLDNDPAILDEVSGLLAEIKSAWDAIPEILNREAQQRQAAQMAMGTTAQR